MTSPTRTATDGMPIGSLSQYRHKAHLDRAAYLRELTASSISKLPEIPAGAKKTASVLAMSLAVATAAFWGVMLTSPPQTAASSSQPAAEIQVVETTAAVSSALPDNATTSKSVASDKALDGYEDR